MDLTGLVKDVLLLSKARSEVVAEQMARRVVHEVRVTSVRQYYAGQHCTLYGMTEGHLWNPTTEQLESYRAKHSRETGARNTLIARGYVEVLENGQPDGFGRFEALIPRQALQRVYLRPANSARVNRSDTVFGQ